MGFDLLEKKLKSQKQSGGLNVKDIVAFVNDDDTAALLEKVKQSQNKSMALYKEGIAEANKRLAGKGERVPHTLIVDLSGSQNPVDDAGTLLYLCEGNARIIGLGDQNDVGLYRELKNLGFQDYLVKPLSLEALKGALKEEELPATSETQKSKTKLLTVVGAKGGCGASTLSLNIAWELADYCELKTALVDLDLHFGTQALALDLEPSIGFAEAVRNPGRIDNLFVSSAMIKATETLSVLSLEENLEDPLEMSTEALERLLGEMKKSYDFVVVDAARHSLELQKRLYRYSDEIIVISDLSLVGIRDTIRTISKIKDINKDAEFKVVVNRTGFAKGVEISVQEFAKAAKVKVDCVIPDEPKNFVLAANNGQPLVALKEPSAAKEKIRGLARKLSGRENSSTSKLPEWLRGLGVFSF